MSRLLLVARLEIPRTRPLSDMQVPSFGFSFSCHALYPLVTGLNDPITTRWKR